MLRSAKVLARRFRFRTLWPMINGLKTLLRLCHSLRFWAALDSFYWALWKNSLALLRSSSVFFRNVSGDILFAPLSNFERGYSWNRSSYVLRQFLHGLLYCKEAVRRVTARTIAWDVYSLACTASRPSYGLISPLPHFLGVCIVIYRCVLCHGQ